MLKVDQLSIFIDEKYIVEDSSFSIPRGKITSIIGGSGSGKSMTVAALLGILPPGMTATGQASFNGMNLIGRSTREMMKIRKSSIFTIFQDAANSFNPSVKMDRQLYSFSGVRKGDSLKQFTLKMTRILDNLGLSVDIFHQYPFELSGGMLQRCMIACALYVEPDLLIADEPTSALDRMLQKEFMDLLKSLNEEQGTTILLITHDLDIVAEAAHEMVVMFEGKVVETGIVEERFKRPEHPYTKRLLESRF
ncbi:ABC transporter ATP-binding protein [Sporosarcina sp. ANT_H38]|uniref:ATP-binding cassette domain-containing protein n=1 Tax=Sporosarcina sp. ANT_H38 TaxID=2597358 RepID=UPI0011F13DA6|nr:ABC transporter ATP-binding protein [Sporosarcina sp. ANT_H38]KAA0948759.1 ABC transporter ATP-binding protein [Sporosarcina sp. ANT_H38]